MKKITGATEARLGLALSMIIFGTVGIFVRYIPLPSAVIAFMRGVIGALCLFVFCIARKKMPSLKNIKSNLLILGISGAAIGVNWIFLFEAYRFTTVGKATLSYYMAPVFVMLLSPVFLKERLSPKKLMCVLGALLGMLFVSGIFDSGISGFGEIKGMLLGVIAAIFYASVIIMNKKLGEISAYDKTMTQLLAASLVILPYSLLRGEFSSFDIGAIPLLLLIVVGVIHTGVAYAMYFGSMNNISAQTVAIYSYIDPILAIILSALILREKMDFFGVVGAVLVLGSTLLSEISFKKTSDEARGMVDDREKK